MLIRWSTRLSIETEWICLERGSVGIGAFLHLEPAPGFFFEHVDLLTSAWTAWLG